MPCNASCGAKIEVMAPPCRPWFQVSFTMASSKPPPVCSSCFLQALSACGRLSRCDTCICCTCSSSSLEEDCLDATSSTVRFIAGCCFSSRLVPPAWPWSPLALSPLPATSSAAKSPSPQPPAALENACGSSRSPRRERAVERHRMREFPGSNDRLLPIRGDRDRACRQRLAIHLRLRQLRTAQHRYVHKRLRRPRARVELEMQRR